MKRLLPRVASCHRIKLRGSDDWKELKTHALLERAERERLTRDAEHLVTTDLQTSRRKTINRPLLWVVLSVITFLGTFFSTTVALAILGRLDSAWLPF